MTHIKALIPAMAALAVLTLTFFLFFAGDVSAQTTTTSTPSFAPNTGDGGYAPFNLLVLSAAGILALIAGSYMVWLHSQRE